MPRARGESERSDVQGDSESDSESDSDSKLPVSRSDSERRLGADRQSGLGCERGEAEDGPAQAGDATVGEAAGRADARRWRAIPATAATLQRPCTDAVEVAGGGADSEAGLGVGG